MLNSQSRLCWPAIALQIIEMSNQRKFVIIIITITTAVLRLAFSNCANSVKIRSRCLPLLLLDSIPVYSITTIISVIV